MAAAEETNSCSGIGLYLVVAFSNWRLTTEKVSNTKTNNWNYVFLLLHIRLNLKVTMEKKLVTVYHEVLRRALVF